MKKTLLFLFLMILILPLEALSFPAFARKYSMTCKTCHSPFPRLKPYGDDFAGNGFKLDDKDAPRYYMETGDDELSLIRDIPLALRFDGYINYNTSNSKSLDFASPYVLKILSGGELTKDVAYYFYFFFSERGEVAGVEDAFVMFNNLFGTELDLYVGQFQVSDPLFKREMRLSFEDYHIYKTKPGFSNADLAYDRGIMLTYGLPTGTDITLEILNGSGIGSANSARLFDNDKNKNFMGRVSQDIGEYFRIGGFAYFGTERFNSIDNKTQMFGPDFSFTTEKIELNFQYVTRKDDNPIFTTFNKEEINTDGIMAELIYMPKGEESKWYSVALFNMVDSEQNNLDYKSYSLNIGHMLRRNIRLVGEYSYIDTPSKKYGRFGVGIVSAF